MFIVLAINTTFLIKKIGESKSNYFQWKDFENKYNQKRLELSEKVSELSKCQSSLSEYKSTLGTTQQELEVFTSHIYEPGIVNKLITPYDETVQITLKSFGDLSRSTGEMAWVTDEKIFNFVKDNIQYSWDLFPISGKSYLVKYPHETLESKVGNCLSQATLLASMLISSGESEDYVRVVIGELDCSAVDCSHGSTHAWVELKVRMPDGDRWLPIDPVFKDKDITYWLYEGVYPVKIREECFNSNGIISC